MCRRINIFKYNLKSFYFLWGGVGEVMRGLKGKRVILRCDLAFSCFQTAVVVSKTLSLKVPCAYSLTSTRSCFKKYKNVSVYCMLHFWAFQQDNLSGRSDFPWMQLHCNFRGLATGPKSDRNIPAASILMSE